jgi:hypothetical protein
LIELPCTLEGNRLLDIISHRMPAA